MQATANHTRLFRFVGLKPPAGRR